MYDWHWRILWLYKDVLAEGALVTLGLTLLTAVCGTLLGAALALLKRSDAQPFAALAAATIELFRALPILVVIIWVYYVTPTLTGLRPSPFVSALIALSLNLAAFVAETVRAGIESVPPGQRESGVALGMTEHQTLAFVIVPQAVRTMVPNLLGLYVTELKNSSLASVIAVGEVLHQANTLISATYRPLEIYSGVAAIYLLLILPLAYAARRVERALTHGDSRALHGILAVPATGL